MNKHNWGFQDLVNRTPLAESARTLAHKFSKYETLAVIGIGGSTVGTEALWNILAPARPAKNIVIFDNVDFVEAERRLARLNLQTTAWYVVSKSGSTLETLAMTEWIVEAHRRQGVAFYERAAVCTEKRKNPLSEWAEKHQIPQLEIPLDVGGRFSVLSPVGLFPLAFAGVNITELMSGAEAATKASDIPEVAQKCFASFAKNPITVFWFYSSVAKPLGAWIQQLWAESLGKKLNRQGKPAVQGSTPLFAVGTCDQHSILQQVAEGARDKFVIFFRSPELENHAGSLPMTEFPAFSYLKNKNTGALIRAAAEGTEQALREAGVPTHRILYPDHSARTLGYLIMWFELLVGELGELLDINAFDQPGVEGSKKITKEILSR
jgi:glucose-6-phosphate isomerase